MRIQLEQHNENWKSNFEKIKRELRFSLMFLNVQIDHIGSTAVQGLSAKPIIDILIGLKDEKDLDLIINPLNELNYVYYELYNNMMPYRRFFIKHNNQYHLPKLIRKEDEIPEELNIQSSRVAHVHVVPNKSIHWLRHIAFKEYLMVHENIKDKYQKLKEKLSEVDWKNGNEYNHAKNDFIKKHEVLALNWYTNNCI